MRLNVQLTNVQGIVLDKISPRFNFITHQNGKDFIRSHRILNIYLQESPGFRVHGRFPQLLGVHFPQTFESLHGQTFLAFLQHQLHQFLKVGNLPFFAAVLQPVGRPPQGHQTLAQFYQSLKIAAT